MEIVERIRQLQSRPINKLTDTIYDFPEVIPDIDKTTSWVRQIVDSTGILDYFKEIQDKILDKTVDKASVIVFLPEQGKIVFAWGKDVKIDKNGCVEECCDRDFSYVLCRVNYKSKTISFWGEKDEPIVLYKEDYIDGNDVVVNAIATTFLNPAKEFEHFDHTDTTDDDPHKTL